MPYPSNIVLDEETETRLRIYLDQQLQNHYAERQNWIDELIKYQRLYAAEPTKKSRDFPFKNASNIVIPLTAISVEAVHSRNETTMFAIPQIVSAQAVSENWQPYERTIERFLDHEIMYTMKARKTFSSCYLNAAKYGNMAGRVTYKKVVKEAVRTINGRDEKFQVVVQDGAHFESIPLARLLFPFQWQDPQLSPWIGIEHEKSPYECMQMEAGGLFYDGMFIGTEDDPPEMQPYFYLGMVQPESGGQKFEQSQQELDKKQPIRPETNVVWSEIWLAFDIDQDGREEEIVVHYHRDSRQFLSIRYNWYDDLHREIRLGAYFPVEDRWTGIGICKMDEQFQKEVTVQHRQRLDNATLANIRMLKISKMSDYGPDEPVFPGKQWFLDSLDQVDSFQLGEVYPSSYNNEQQAVIYSQQRTGVNEVTLGMPQVGTPGTATSDLARIQEGARKFDYIFQNLKEFTSEIIQDTAVVTQQFGPRTLAYYDTAENGQIIKQFFQMPVELIREGLLITFRASSQHHNKIIDRQDWSQVSGFLQQYYVNLLQLAEGIGNPQLMQTILTKAMGASTEAMRQILETFDIKNIDRLTLSDTLTANQLNPQQQQGEIPPEFAEFVNNNGLGEGGTDLLSQIAALTSNGNQG